MSSNNINPFSDLYNDIFEDSTNELLSPFDPLDDSWPLFQEILQLAPENNDDQIINAITLHEPQQQQEHDLAAAVDEEQADAGTLMLGNGLKSMSIRARKSNTVRKRKSRITNNNDEDDAEEAGPSSSSAPKKLDHNAKERIRRMKLNASYLALQALLPHQSRRSKKRSYSAPAIVDRALKYIPELQNEIQELRSKKEHFIPSPPKLKNNTVADCRSRTSKLHENPTVSITGVDREEAIVQICMARKGDTEDAFTSLLQSVEDEGMCIKSAASLGVCESRMCYVLHVQINQSSSEDDGIEVLREKVISWLR